MNNEPTEPVRQLPITDEQLAHLNIIDAGLERLANCNWHRLTGMHPRTIDVAGVITGDMLPTRNSGKGWDHVLTCTDEASETEDDA